MTRSAGNIAVTVKFSNGKQVKVSIRPHGEEAIEYDIVPTPDDGPDLDRAAENAFRCAVNRLVNARNEA